MSGAIDLMQLAIHGANTLVAAMVTSTWQGARSSLQRFFGRSEDSAGERQIEMLDEDKEKLTTAPPELHSGIEKELQQRWTIQLAALLQQHPEAANELQDILKKISASSTSNSSSPTLNATGNQNSQIIQAGRDLVTGGGDITYRNDRE